MFTSFRILLVISDVNFSESTKSDFSSEYLGERSDTELYESIDYLLFNLSNASS